MIELSSFKSLVFGKIRDYIYHLTLCHCYIRKRRRYKFYSNEWISMSLKDTYGE